MRLLTRFAAKAFVKPFFYSLALFALLIFLGHVFDKLTVLLRTEAPAWSVAKYLALQVPYWTVRIVPLATLLGTLLCLAELVRSGEWVSILASGFRPAQVLAPMLGCAALVSVGAFVAQETVLPYAYGEAERIYHHEIRRRPVQERWNDVVLISKPGQFLMARVFDVRESRMSRVLMDTHGEARVQLDALEAVWDGKRWVFLNGVKRTFAAGALIAAQERPFDRLETDLDSPPQELVPVTQEPDEMSLTDTLRHIRRLRRLGASSRKAEVAAHAKIAFPLANLVVFALAVPFGLKMRRAQRSLGFATALVLGFTYWWALSLGQMAGEAGALPGWVGAWLANMLFGAAAAYGLSRAEL